jgi:phytanoyl-CoA hydroxylase
MTGAGGHPMEMSYKMHEPVDSEFVQGQSYPDQLYTVEQNGWQVPTLGDLNAEALSRYDDQGYVMVAEVFSVEQIEGAVCALDDLLTGKNPDFKGVHLEDGRNGDKEGSNAKPSIDKVRKFSYFTEYDARLQALSTYPPLIDVLENIVGEPVQLFQDMALLKPPGGGREKPWHQDQAYFDYPLETKVVGVWIALDEAQIENGCMHLMPGSHKEGPEVHFKRRDWQICDDDMLGATCVAAPLKPGGILLFDGLLKHGSPENASPYRRRALQYHYRPSTAQPTSEADRLRVFGSEGRDVSC